jgi:DNA repair protein RadC
MAINDWPAAERPREKLLEKGASALSDAELLAIFLRTGRHGVSAVELARELLSTFGGLKELFLADQSRFCAVPGLGAAKYAQLQASMEMTRRYLDARMSREAVMDSPAATRDYLRTRLGPR